MELLENLDSNLALIVKLAKFILEFISVLCVILGLVKTLQQALRFRHSPTSLLGNVRLCFATWLALALEFQLGADILATTISPSFDTLGKLGLLAVIRIVLNYFLGKEIKEEMEIQKMID
jgi:uncharacterized membrane protein